MSASTGCTTLSGHLSRDEKSPTRMSELRSTPVAARLCRPPSAGAVPLAVLALAAVLAVTFAVPARASDRWFTIEIVVFDDLRDEGLHVEHWPADPGEPSLQDAIELTHRHEDESADVPRAFRLVSRSDLSLGAVWNGLRRSAHYRPFLHVGWRLPGLPHEAARPAHVSPRLVDGGAGAATRVGSERPAVHGTLEVSLARYLRIDVDLLYTRPASRGATEKNTTPARFRLVSERRMRSGELHYIDHPLFGVLILATPFQPEHRRVD